MKVYVLALALLLPAVCASAAAKKSAPPPPQAPPVLQHWDVKGATLGGRWDDVRAQLTGDVTCNATGKDSADQKVGIDQTCSSTERKCNKIGAQEFCHNAPKGDTFAGQSVLLSYGLHDGVVWKINVLGISPAAFDSVVATMESKYGKPVLVKSDIQNPMGAHFEDGLATWHGLDTILYKKYQDRLDAYSRLEFFCAEAWAQREDAIKNVHEAAKSDM